MNILKVLTDNKIVKSFAEARRLLHLEGIKCNDKPVKDTSFEVNFGDKISVGKKVEFILKDSPCGD